MSMRTTRGSAVIALFLAAWLARDAGAAPRRFTFGVISEGSGEAEQALVLYLGLLESLRPRVAAAGVEVAPLVVARDARDLARRIRRSEVDAFAEGVFPSLTVRSLTGSVQPGLLALRRGEREYRSVIFVARAGPVRSLGDLEGRIIAFQAPRSTSAHALPKAELERLGHDLRSAEDLGGTERSIRYVFAGAEINQAFWVLHGKADAGAFNEGDWARLPAGVRDRLRIIHETPFVPRWIVSFRTGLDPATRRAVENALVALGDRPGDRTALGSARIERFARLTEADRQSIERWASVFARPGGER